FFKLLYTVEFFSKSSQLGKLLLGSRLCLRQKIIKECLYLYRAFGHALFQNKISMRCITQQVGTLVAQLYYLQHNVAVIIIVTLKCPCPKGYGYFLAQPAVIGIGYKRDITR